MLYIVFLRLRIILFCNHWSEFDYSKTNNMIYKGWWHWSEWGIYKRINRNYKPYKFELMTMMVSSK